MTGRIEQRNGRRCLYLSWPGSRTLSTARSLMVVGVVRRARDAPELRSPPRFPKESWHEMPILVLPCLVIRCMIPP